MIRRLALAYLALSSPLMLVAFFVGGPAMEVLFAVLAAAFPVALIVLGLGSSPGPLGWVLGVLVLMLEAAVVAMLAWRGQVDGGPWVLGLPLSTAIQVYGVFLAPLPLVSFAYALTFDRFGLRRDQLDGLRQRFGGPRKPVDTVDGVDAVDGAEG